MSEIDGGALVGRALANEGIEKAFVLCGGHIMPIFYGMRHAGIEIIDLRHECSAVYAAIAYTRASGKPAGINSSSSFSRSPRRSYSIRKLNLPTTRRVN